jgi:CubicO group peptidase (beta-lactamase class C family)
VEETVTTGGFSSKRLARVRDVLSRHLDAGYVPGAVAVVARRGEVHIEAMGTLAFEGEGSRTPMAADTICRTGSMTKPIVAACAMTLVEDCTLRLDDPVDEFLPELADMTVLADPNGPLEDTVPAGRPITLRDLLTFTLGTGMVPAPPGTVPISDALNALQGDDPEPPDEWIRRLGELPLVYQPGDRWMYHTAANVTGVLIARATGLSFGDALRERVCEPLGMTDTGFSVPAGNIGRLSTAYELDAAGKLVIEDGPDGYWSRPQKFEDGGGGIVSTAADYLAFASALLAGGARRGQRVLSRPSVTLMTTDHLTPAQKAVSGFTPGYFDDIGWGFGMSVRTRRPHAGPWPVSYPPLASVGSYGWPGVYGTGWCNDPAEDLTTILMTQRAPAPPGLPILFDFWTAAYQAIDD